MFAFCVINFEPIEVQTRLACQNDCLNLSFVKYIYVDGRKLARNGQKTAIRAGGLGRLLLTAILLSLTIVISLALLNYSISGF